MSSRSADNSSVSLLVAGLAALVSVYSVVALVIGWMMGVDLLVRHPVTQAAMVPATALCFALMGAAIVGVYYNVKAVSLTLCCAVIAICAATVVAQSIGWIEIAALFAIEIDTQDRMAPATAVLFLLAAVGVLQLSAARIGFVNAVGIFGLSASLCAFVWSHMELGSLSGVPFCMGMSLQTAALFGLLFLSMCLSGQQDDLAASDEDAGLI